MDRAPDTATTPRLEGLGALEGLEDLVGSDPAAALARARQLSLEADVAGDVVTAWSARTWQAEALQRLGETSAAAALVAELRAADVVLPAEVTVRAAWILARIFTDVGDHVTALEHVLEATGGLDDTVPLRVRIRVLIKVADVLDELGSLDEARTWYGRAEALADGDGQLHMLVVNNLAYSEFLARNAPEAQHAADRLQELAQRYDRPLNANALDTVARIHLLRGDDEVAAQVARTAVAANAAMDSKNADDLPVLLLTLAVAQRRLGDLEGAAGTLAQAQQFLDLEDFGDLRADLLEERAELLAQQGDFEAAFAAHKAFHAADKELLSLRREAQARARQSLYEATAARQEAELFREQARRDPLTGLWNRLHVDEVLPGLVDGAASSGGCLAAALLDLDHFKSVNDTFSHEVGDEVLRVVAGLFADAAAEAGGGSFAARLGGEEFLLVVLTPGPVPAFDVVEAVRRSVEVHDWSATTPGRGVTVSAGIAFATRDCTKTTLLARADALLYAAKAAGRNLVEVEPVA